MNLTITYIEIKVLQVIDIENKVDNGKNHIIHVYKSKELNKLANEGSNDE